MALILSIDSSVAGTHISLAQNGKALQTFEDSNSKNNAGQMHVVINEIMTSQNIKLSHIDAVAVSIGPGSYTGLRVSLSTAKGLCYALKKPLITVGTLEIMANAAIIASSNAADLLFCPMIDARRMEVFTALYNFNLDEIEVPHALILSQTSFANLLNDKKILFFGDGVPKWKQICNHVNALYWEQTKIVNSLNLIALERLNQNKFADLAYIEPLYVKEFYKV
jgi:tRNA threonylcarbamoyladenosine biosynthesis protein TsaB